MGERAHVLNAVAALFTAAVIASMSSCASNPNPSGNPSAVLASGSASGASLQATPAPSASASPEARQSPTPALVVQKSRSPVQFRSPSGNITCVLANDVRCTAATHTWRAPPRPADCDPAAYGDTLLLPRNGQRAELLCRGDTTVFGEAPILPYGHAWQVAANQCISEKRGVRCRNLSTQHGFEVSQRAYRLF